MLKQNSVLGTLVEFLSADGLFSLLLAQKTQTVLQKFFSCIVRFYRNTCSVPVRVSLSSLALVSLSVYALYVNESVLMIVHSMGRLHFYVLS